MNTLGLNVLAQTVPDHLKLATQIARSHARAILIMDAPELAATLARQHPAMAVVHRAWRENDASLHLHEDTTPAKYLNEIASASRNGVILQALNEPSGYTDVPVLVQWCVEIMRLASARGIRLALPNFAVGHPDEALIANGVFDPLLRAFTQHRGHVLAAHEYFQEAPEREPHHIGRFRSLLARAEAIRVDKPVVLITEAGRDVGGGPRDGWRDTGWSENAYNARLRSMADIQERLGAVGACVFGYGAGFGGRWSSFDVAGADAVLNDMAAYNRSKSLVRSPVRSPVRLRQLPTVFSPAVKTLARGTVVAHRAAGIRREGWTWLACDGGGWIAAEAARV